MLKILKLYKKEMIFGPIFKLIEAGIEISLPIIIAQLIDKYKELTNKQILAYILYLTMTIIIGFICASISQYLAAKTSQGYGRRLREMVIKKVSDISEKQLKKIGSSAIVNRMVSDVTNIETAISMFIRLALRVPLTCIGSLIMIFIIDKRIGILVTIALIILTIFIYVIFKISSKIQKKVNSKTDRLLLKVKENIENIQIIRSCNSQEYEQERFEVKNMEIKNMALKYNYISNSLEPTSILILNLTIIWILYSYKLKPSNITLGELIAIINYITQMVSAVIVLSNLIIIYTKAIVSIKRVQEILEIQPNIVYGKKDKMKLTENAIQFKNVTFSYNQENNLFNNLNLTIKTGEIIGVIGFTGSGKSTLLNIISRKYDIISGKIEIFENDIKEYTRETLKDNIKIISQKKNFFTTTIEENIKLRRKCE